MPIIETDHLPEPMPRGFWPAPRRPWLSAAIEINLDEYRQALAELLQVEDQRSQATDDADAVRYFVEHLGVCPEVHVDVDDKENLKVSAVWRKKEATPSV